MPMHSYTNTDTKAPYQIVTNLKEAGGRSRTVDCSMVVKCLGRALRLNFSLKPENKDRRRLTELVYKRRKVFVACRMLGFPVVRQ